MHLHTWTMQNNILTAIVILKSLCYIFIQQWSSLPRIHHQSVFLEELVICPFFERILADTRGT